MIIQIKTGDRNLITMAQGRVSVESGFCPPGRAGDVSSGVPGAPQWSNVAAV